MGVTFQTRLVPNNQTVVDQADFFESDQYTRVFGLVGAALEVRVFFQNAPQPWPLTDGTGVPDALISSGRIYWSEVPGTPGYYSVRWRPNAVGFWRIVLSYPFGEQIISYGYDVVSSIDGALGGLSSSFSKPTSC